MNWIVRILEIVLGLLFIYAGAVKVIPTEEFAAIIDNYNILPTFLINGVALFLPWLEVVVGICLLVGLFRRGSAFILLLLMAVFIVAQAYVVVNGLDVACGCFSVDKDASKADIFSLTREGITFLAALFVFIYNMKKFDKPLSSLKPTN